MAIASPARADVRTAPCDLDRLRELVIRDVRLEGRFKLASGQVSRRYYDSKLLTLRPEGARLVGQAFLAAIAEMAPHAEAVGGLTLGADPIVSSIVLLSADTDRPLDGLIVRKEPKTHGTGRWIEGPLRPGAGVVVVDDVVTTGGSARQAVERLRTANVTVAAAIALIDRLEGFQATMADLGVPARAILTVRDLD